MRAKSAAQVQADPSQAACAPVVNPPVKPLLMLPAPAEDPTMAALEALRGSLEGSVERRCPSPR
jgi:hypothetical protein